MAAPGWTSGSPPVISTRRPPLGPDRGQNLVDVHAGAAVEGVRGVAPDAPQRAPGQADEGARESRPGGLPLYGVEDLRDADRPRAARVAHHAGSPFSLAAIRRTTASFSRR